MSIPMPKLPEGIEAGKLVFKLLNIRENKVIGRKEVTAEAWHVGLPTPSRVQLREEIAKAMGVDVKQVYVVRVITEYGRHRSVIEAHVYDDPNVGERIEPLYIRLRNMPKEEAKKIREEMKKRKTEKKAAAKKQ
ncbi:30S ribosomal protein S24e [Vulcanisaeta distributa]|uniref:Small ribosomal subunit protein eS24 n=1 Tax=Vulcanisaeta distributa (strain DSM 14429 / JCM 11212 / NBRC 100878 / IC-017) TaxID=572478 RepID=E1QU19_VULDI|nr:30S ribosomal protein S24 [Vulcanisaeta distributa]ADN49816.1 Ribosomal protein S24e [Vulcanisaeta distributa DSM 14429]